ncbi:OmpA family protein [Sphingomonas sp. NSE70-1]|uniref:OmpA family protein n=1 Tax=Sphingomonas caseinilyticus TaxID=2908205 RepID=A0ABT0RTL1_9SPHN|nr:OmpA family protein [Sphingomonas caseinilyticus]
MRALGLGAACLMLAGCATSSLVLLPDDEGHQGSVAVLEADGQASQSVISQGNSRTKLGEANANPQPLGEKGLKPEEAALLTTLPPPAKSFTLYFDQGTTTPTVESQSVLTALRAEIASRSGPQVEVTGHTDTVGSEEDNDRLSLQRAEEILNWLAGQGIDRSLMLASGRGERDLKEPSIDNFSSATNRRVEVIVR